MKKIIILCAITAMIGCQKTELPSPENAKPNTGNSLSTISEIYKNGRLTYKYYYTNRRVSRIEYLGQANKLWTYDDANMQATSTESLTRYVYQYDNKKQLQYFDCYVKDQFQYRKWFYYKHNAFVSTKTVPAIPFRTDEFYYYKGPWEYNIAQATNDQNGNPKEQQMITIATWVTPFILERYDNEARTLLSVRSKFSSSIRTPDYNIPEFPQPWDMDMKPPFRKLLFDWTEVPTDNDPNLLRMEILTYYDRDAGMYVIVTTEDVKLNAEGLPTEYNEVGRWYPGGRIQSTNQYRFVYTTL